MPSQTIYYSHLQKHCNASLCFRYSIIWFWRNAVPNISCFNVFQFLALTAHWKHLNFYMLVLLKKLFGKCMCWNFVQKIWMKTMFGFIWVRYFQKLYWYKYVWEMYYNRFLQGAFSVQSILPNIFSMKHFGRYFKKGFWKYNDSREMLQKKTTDFWWNIVTRCLPEDVLLHIFGQYTPNMFEAYNCGHLQKLIEEYLRRFAKTCFEKLFSEVPPIRPGERNIWETCPKRCVYRFFRREMFSPFWVEMCLVDTKLEHIPQCFPRNL